MGRVVLLSGVLLLVSACGRRGPRIDEVVFQSGEFRVVGDLTVPDGQGPHPVVVFVHGDGPNNRTSGVTYPPIMQRMLRAGYATFAWDKPGTGESTGEIDRDRLIEQRSASVLDAIEVLKARPDIDRARIGLWGISQAGFIMPAVIAASDDVSFVIAISCPGESGVEQGAYLVSAQARCAGHPDEEVEALEELLAAVEYATTYDEYVKHKTALRQYPAYTALADQGVFVGVRPEADWHPPDLDGEYFRDPMTLVAQTRIPILAVFGERDTQADPIQGAGAYEEVLSRTGNPFSRVEVISGVDHNIVLSQTGCIEERERRSAEGWRDYPPQYLDLIEDWLTALREED